MSDTAGGAANLMLDDLYDPKTGTYRWAVPEDAAERLRELDRMTQAWATYERDRLAGIDPLLDEMCVEYRDKLAAIEGMCDEVGALGDTVIRKVQWMANVVRSMTMHGGGA